MGGGGELYVGREKKKEEYRKIHMWKLSRNVYIRNTHKYIWMYFLFIVLQIYNSNLTLTFNLHLKNNRRSSPR